VKRANFSLWEGFPSDKKQIVAGRDELLRQKREKGNPVGEGGTLTCKGEPWGRRERKPPREKRLERGEEKPSVERKKEKKGTQNYR